jgi:hypothetical protein
VFIDSAARIITILILEKVKTGNTAPIARFASPIPSSEPKSVSANIALPEKVDAAHRTRQSGKIARSRLAQQPNAPGPIS